MKVGTHLATTLETSTPNELQYDQNAKELLADVQILARILQHTVEEVKGLSVEEIIECIDQKSIEIGKTAVDPGLTNLGKIHGQDTENILLHEGTIYFDIRCTLSIRDKELKVIVNVEAQKSTDSGKLHYHLENRIVYYLSRLISAQKDTEFFHADYDKIKKVYSVWICMDADDEQEGITQISLCEQTLYGAAQNFKYLDKMCGIIIHIRSGLNVQESKNKLITMLEDVFRKESMEIKKDKLQDKYGMQMTVELERKLEVMCNLSEVVLAAGREEGIKEGIADASIQIARKMFEKGMSFEDVCDVVEQLSREDLEKIYREMQ